ncbi:MAG: sigma-54 dependent transcriptional regulator [Candidatus Neomarinimicrobiota bacterium]
MKNETACILIIDDSQSFMTDLSLLLEKEDYRILTAADEEKGLALVRTENIDLVLLDLFFKNSTDGLTILKKIKNISPPLPVIMITDYSSVETAVLAMQQGALDYISKTPDINRLRLLIRKALDEPIRQLQKDSLRADAERSFNKIVGRSEAVQKIREQIMLFTNIDSPVLIVGETGTGKELVARQLHTHGARAQAPFIPINCAALPANLIESELFGYEKGAFTGAAKRKPGKFEVAENGTLFLDEVSRLAHDAQLKLLRVLQENEFQRVGGNDTIHSRCRIIAATNERLEALVKEGRFREDLYYRLNVLSIIVPPLRERAEDIEELTAYLSKQICTELKISVKRLSADATEVLKNYAWPGNVRELQNVLTRAFILNRDKAELDSRDLSLCLTPPSEIQAPGNLLPTPRTMQEFQELKEKQIDSALRRLEKQFVTYLMERFNGNITLSSHHIGLSRTNFYKMMQRCGYKSHQGVQD